MHLPAKLAASGRAGAAVLSGKFPAARGRSSSKLKVLPSPYPFPRYGVKQHWHRSQHDDPGNRWLRALVLRLFGRGAT